MPIQGVGFFSEREHPPAMPCPGALEERMVQGWVIVVCMFWNLDDLGEVF